MSGAYPTTQGRGVMPSSTSAAQFQSTSAGQTLARSQTQVEPSQSTAALPGAALFDAEPFEIARQCIEGGNVPAFRQAIARLNVNMQDVEDEGNTLLHWAVGYNNVSMARELLLRGARQLGNDVGMTPFELSVQAFQSGDASYFAIKQLFEQGVSGAQQ
jgi:ankyrin repeat protein